MRPRYSWNLGARTLALGERTLVMGIVNVTPDSFSDGGMFGSSAQAVDYALDLLAQGADILDIGGESTRPGASVLPGSGPSLAGAVSAAEELSRVLPVIQGVKRACPHAIVSIDTYKAEVARAAVAAGAEIVNDVSGFQWDSAMSSTLASLACGAILMHMRGRPEQWRTLAPEPQIVSLVWSELAAAADAALAAGISRDRLVLDPGFGFGKNFDENYPLLAHFDQFASLGFPLLAATSRKSFLGRTAGRRIAELTGHEPVDLSPQQRLSPTLASTVGAVLRGAHIIRVHDVRPAVEAVAIVDAILAAG